ncbi:hypothetical protein, partial [Microbacterium sp.]|uniref:hypothetical protein n=1 Tax=Microbacterium sp. TaxID=51671 RepID=UPI003C74BD1C
MSTTAPTAPAPTPHALLELAPVDLAAGMPGPAAQSVCDAARDVVGLGTHLGATIDWAVRAAAYVPLPGPPARPPADPPADPPGALSPDPRGATA